ncbi:MAG TPA: DnaA/Hda family protein [Nevskiaceae bacterium]|nr:DnaA/Hda family protein [Nevskiaceae bacterium]
MTSVPVQLALGVRWMRAPDFGALALGHNGEAVASVTRAATTPNTRVLLHGAPGTGKTHLLQAAARLAYAHRRRAACLTLSDDAEALSGYEDFDLVCVDACEAVAHRPQVAVALMRLIDGLTGGHGSLLLASRDGPDALAPYIPVDLRTRLQACVVYAMQPLDDASLHEALQRQARARGLGLDDGVADYLVHHLPRNLKALIGVLEQLDQASLSTQRRLTIPFVQRHLGPSNAAPGHSSARIASD